MQRGREEKCCWINSQLGIPSAVKQSTWLSGRRYSSRLRKFCSLPQVLKHSRFGDRCFAAAAGPRIWNKLPASSMRDKEVSCTEFRKQLKTFMFQTDCGASWLFWFLRLIDTLTYLLTYLLTYYLVRLFAGDSCYWIMWQMFSCYCQLMVAVTTLKRILWDIWRRWKIRTSLSFIPWYRLVHVLWSWQVQQKWWFAITFITLCFVLQYLCLLSHHIFTAAINCGRLHLLRCT